MRRCRLTIFAAVAGAALLLASCRGEHKETESAPLCHNSAFNIYPDSIDLHLGVILRAGGDSLLQVRVEGNTLRSLALPPSSGVDNRPEVHTSFPIFNLLLRAEQSAASAALPSYGGYLAPLELYLNPLDDAAASSYLLSKIKNGYVIPSETRNFSWPVINDNAFWLLAAAEVAKLRAEPRFTQTVAKVAANSSAIDREMTYNPSIGLVGGIPRYLLPYTQLFPAWMRDIHFASSYSMAVNAAYWSALHAMEALGSYNTQRNLRIDIPAMALDADTLRSAILRNMWMPERSSLSAMLYGGAPFSPLQLAATDNAGQALAVISGLTSSAMSRSVIARGENTPQGVSLFYPALSATTPHAALRKALHCLWAVAASRSGDAAAYNTALGVLLRDAASEILVPPPSPVPASFARPLEAFVLRGLLGATIHPDGIEFAPSVPPGMNDTLTVRNLRVHHSSISVTVEGAGSSIASCEINGKPSKKAFIPYSAAGAQKVVIKLTPDSRQSSSSEAPAPRHIIAPAPETAWITASEATVGNTPCVAYVNGVAADEFGSPRYELFPEKVPVWVQFASIGQDIYAAFASEPHLYIPPGRLRSIRCTQVAHGGTRIIEDRNLAAMFVESNRWKNRSLRFETEVADSGRYLIDVHYLQGLGIVNARRRRSAVRRLVVNGEKCGTFLFPQLSVSMPEKDEWREWQSLTAFTNPLEATLRKGVNIIDIRYFQPSPVFVDPEANTVLTDYIRLIRL